jgi:ribonuclease VapC
VIVVDTSVFVAIVLKEPAATASFAALRAEEEILVSAGSIAEALVVAARRGFTAEMTSLIDQIDPDIVPITAAAARRIGEVYRRWGKGLHPAALNFGDCFAYALAKERGCKLLYVGGDFAKTDIESAL